MNGWQLAQRLFWLLSLSHGLGVIGSRRGQTVLPSMIHQLTVNDDTSPLAALPAIKIDKRVRRHAVDIGGRHIKLLLRFNLQKAQADFLDQVLNVIWMIAQSTLQETSNR